MPRPRDPYASPRPPRDFMAPLVRLVVIAALLGAAVWGYRAYSNGSGPFAARHDRGALVEDGYATPEERPEFAPPPDASQAAPATTDEAPGPGPEAPPPG